MNELRVLDLFSGIGGFSLGLERTGGFKTVAFCEIEPFCQRVLRKHWPDIPIYEDIRDLTAERLRADGISVDVVTGGFPCQDISIAGLKAGIDGAASGLWRELHRIIGDVGPRYAIVENVADLLSGPSERRGAWFGRVLRDLAGLGMDVEWHRIPASVLGAPHVRPRLWIVAYGDGAGRLRWPSAAYRHESWQGGKEQLERLHEHCIRVAIPARSHGRIHDGVSSRVDRLRGLGNAVVPQIPELIGRAILEAEGR